ncbi:DUF262 domain-containing protein [Hymenobacter sp. BT770]|uniref:DUF262 domain-containing protein n=1 Tax=Hymenobacter sp. BT770 TaxID=2886942 RepID=UPI001D0FF590|nr:DUF262 domain-containing protein [Hymenobacter sp. BT770]MCC3154600.1 DUF262 domain-containing protein [Hymenobacter sp. BT770]MDO3416654.1 DUF262 domain-containing protein [Hymenobacter sp. BT770]
MFKTQIMSFPFGQQDVAVVSVSDYISWYLDAENSHYNLIQLPPIQRNAVWNIAQVERLWDSLLRGFPIGSMLLGHRKSSQNSRQLTSSLQSTSTLDGFFLLDGQQRTRALLLGFQPSATSRLWVDLSSEIPSDKPEHNDRRFILRLLTNHQPWGMRRRNPTEGLNESEKFKARRELPSKPRYDYLTSPVASSSEDAKAISWPADAEVPVPLDALISLCRGWSGQFKMPTWEQVSLLIPPYFSKPTVAPIHLDQLLVALQQLLSSNSAEGMPSRSLPLLLHPGDIQPANPDKENAPDAIEVLFQRVNAGGTVLAGEEMSYSLLKSTWDKAYDLVTQITEDKEVGYLLSPTKVVMAAARLARRQQGYQDLNPSVPQFRRWLSHASTNTEANPFLQCMEHLLAPGDNQSTARFKQTLVEFCKLALYNPKASQTDPGLPKKLLLEVNPLLMHPVFSWILANLSSSDLLAASRLSMLRYLMYAVVVNPDAQKFARLAGEVLTGQSGGQCFPDQAIFSQWMRKAGAPAMPGLQQIILDIPANTTAGWLSNGQELFGRSEATEELSADPYHSFRSHFWHHSKLMLWFQRAYLQEWFVGYDPMSQDAADTPFDYDHILPYSHAVCSGRTLKLYEEGKGADRFYGHRWFYINSLGNLRAWPAWANRSDGNKCHTDKLHLKSTDAINSEVATTLQLVSPADFLQASAIPSTDHQLWVDAGGHPGYWPVSRRAAWQQAVERRVSALYDNLFIALDFKEWQGLEVSVNEQVAV